VPDHPVSGETPTEADPGTSVLTRMVGIFFLLLLGGIPTPTRGATQDPAPTQTIIVGVNLVDLTGGPPLLNAVVRVEGDRIAAIEVSGSENEELGGGGTRPEVIDAAGLWLVPGLMNMHVHFGLVLPGVEGAALVNETEAELALRMAEAARGALLAGVTTVRTTGERGHVDLALARAIGRGAAEGPRIFSAGEAVQVTGGHGSAVGERANDGPFEFREAARLQIRAGARWIKVSISGGIATPGGDIAAAFMTQDEMEAVTDIAHRLGAKVTAHSGSPVATRQAVQAGVDGIEHGYFLTPDVFDLMRRNSTWFVPTIVVAQPATLPFFERIGSPQWYLDRVEMVGKRHFQALRDAITAGVQIALGTDQLPQEPNDGTISTVREAEYYVEAGMTPLQALRAGTIEAARMLGVENEVGSIEVGKLADLILVDSNPAEDVSALRSIRLVMKGGKVVRSDLKGR
jgi:imidazolonepropionase-like amidohydrolase